MSCSRYLSIVLVVSLAAIAHAENSIEIHDAHIHYDQDVWEAMPAADAINYLKEQNIQRALVSSTPTEGTEILYRHDPGFVVPMLRPYDSWRHRYFWYRDPELKSYLLSQLGRVPYRGIGEFHVFGKNMDTFQIEKMIELARQYKLALHAHTDLEGMQILLKKAKGLVVVWAHGGGDVDEKYLQKFLDEYPHFYIELSLRERMLDDDEKLTQFWKNILSNYSRRFLLGMDTYKNSRWSSLPETAEETRKWLRQLPSDVIADIARNNLERLFPKKLSE